MWIERMLDWYGRKGIISGPVFRDMETGMSVRASVYWLDILSELDNIQKDGRGLISTTINVYEEYGVSRSFRRGSNTHAINQGVTEPDINHNNRWSMVELAKGMTPKLGMQQHYAEVLQMLTTLLRYSSAL